MSKGRAVAFRSLRKAANITRRATSKAANFSGRVENKADRIIHGTDPTVQIHNTVQFEKIYAEALGEITPIHPSMPLAGRQPSVTLMIPSLQKSSFFGGTATALIVAGLLAKKREMPIRIVETLRHGGEKSDKLADFFEQNKISIGTNDISIMDLSARRYNHYGYMDIHPEDIYVASAWWDAHLLNNLPLQRKYIYLIQDYEPIFYNNSDKYIYAERTYKTEKFVPVCNTELMYQFMNSKGYNYIKENAIWFEPAVGVKNISKTKPSNKKQMFIYGRPSVARNLFFFTLNCLDELFASQKLDPKEWEICMAGQDNITSVVLSSGISIKNLGKMNMDKYHELVQSTDLAISPMMAPHPNYPTLEFASAGAAVVTTRYETKKDLSKYSKNIFMADYTEESFEKAVLSAIALTAEQRIKNSKNSKVETDWNKALSSAISSLLKIY